MSTTSTSAAMWSSLFNLYLAIALVVGALVTGWLFYNLIAFRERPDRPRPADAPLPGVIPRERGHILWVYVMAGAMAIIMFGLAFGTLGATTFLEHPPEEQERIYVDVTGFQFGWIFYYPDGDFQSINELVVPVDTVVVMNVTSRDVWHNFAIPDYRIRIDAIPGETTLLWFEATATGNAEIPCVVICGTGHALMRGQLDVRTADAYQQWRAEKMPAPAQQEGGEAAPEDTTAALTLEPVGFVTEKDTLPPSSTVTLTVTNMLGIEAGLGVGPIDTPWDALMLPAGASGTLTFETPSEGIVTVWSLDLDTGEADVVHEMAVVSE